MNLIRVFASHYRVYNSLIKILLPAIIFTVFTIHTSEAQVTQKKPDSTLQTADWLPFDTIMIASIIPAGTDPEIDWFMFVPPGDGSITVYTHVTQNTMMGILLPLNWILFDKSGDYVDSWEMASGETGNYVADSFQIACMASDTFYFEVACNSFTYDTHSFYFLYNEKLAVFENDTGPDNSMQQAAALPYNSAKEGNLDFYNDTSYDYYRAILPTDGQINIYTEAESEETTPQTINVELLDKKGNYVNTWNINAGANDVPVKDTLTMTCMPADTFYISLYVNTPGVCGFSYRLSYNILAPDFANDTVPDSTMQLAVFLPPNTNMDGHLNFYNDTSKDFYKVVLANDGQFQIHLGAETEESTPTQTINVNLFDKNGNFINGWDAIAGVNNTVVNDTMISTCMSADTFYIELYIGNTGQCGFAYRLSYNLLPTIFANDTAQNNYASHAIFFPPDTLQTDHQGYYNRSGLNWFKIYKSDTGNIFLYTAASQEEDDTAGRLSVSFLDADTSYLGQLNAPIGINGQTAYDTLIMSAGAADTFYLRVSFINGVCGSYSLEYPKTSPVMPNSINKLNALLPGVIVAPNPSSGIFSFRFNHINPQSIRVYDTEGRLIETEIITAPGNFQLNATNYAAGIYYAAIEGKDGATAYLKLAVVRGN